MISIFTFIGRKRTVVIMRPGENRRSSMMASAFVIGVCSWVVWASRNVREYFRRLAPHVKPAAIAAFIGAITLVQPVAAQQDFCSTEMGSFTEAITSSFGTIAIAAIVLAILIGVAARPFIRSGTQASALNGVMSKAFAGLIILVLFVPIISWGLEFTPFAPATQCIPFLGG